MAETQGIITQAKDAYGQQAQDATRQAVSVLSQDADRPYGDPDQSVATSDCVAHLLKPKLVDPSGGALTVTLAAFTRADAGKVYVVKNDSASTNTITVQGPSTSVLVDGAQTATITTARGSLVLLVVGHNKLAVV